MKFIGEINLRNKPHLAALQRLDEHLASRKGNSNSAIIRLLLETMFGDVNDSEETGKMKIPDQNP